MMTPVSIRILDAEPPAGTGRAAPGDAAEGFLALLGDALAAGAGETSPLNGRPQADAKAPPKGRPLPAAAPERAGDDDKTDLAAGLLPLRPPAPAPADGGRAPGAAKSGGPEGDDAPEPSAALSALLAMLPPAAPRPAEAQAAPGARPAPQAAAGVGAAPTRSPEADRPSAAVPAAALTNAGQQAPAADAPPALATATPTAAPAAGDPGATAAPPVPVISTAAAAVTTHPAAAVNAQLGTPEWQQSVSQHITLFTRQGQHSAELKLHPQDLGQITISMKVEDNQAQLQMVSGHGHVRAALEAALPQLRSQLADSGIQLTQSSISGDASGGQPQQESAFHQPPGAHFAEGNRGAADDEESLSAPASLQARARGDGAVDTFA